MSRILNGLFVAIVVFVAQSEVLAQPYAYVANQGNDTVSVIDTATNAVVPPAIPVGERPWSIAITPNGRSAYVANIGDDTVSVIDTTTNTL